MAVPFMEPCIFEAAFYGDIRYMLQSIRSSLDISAKNNYGQTAIHISAANGHIKCVEILLNHGVAVDIVDSNDCTPLHWAVRHGHFEATKLLVEKGANTHRLTGKGYSLLDIAKSRGHSDLVWYIKQILEGNKSPWE